MYSRGSGENCFRNDFYFIIQTYHHCFVEASNVMLMNSTYIALFSSILSKTNVKKEYVMSCYILFMVQMHNGF